MLVRQAPLAVQIREWAIERALKPTSGIVRLDDFCEAAGVSRTPTREGLACLEMVGLIEQVPYRGFQFTFEGREDIQRRARVLGAAVTAGRPELGSGSIASRVARAGGGMWAEVAWSVLKAWPRHSGEWGVDLRSSAGALADVERRICAAGNAQQLGAAISELGEVY